MYLQCLLICHGQSYAEEEAALLLKSNNLRTFQQLRETQSFKKEILCRLDLIDSKLTPNSLNSLLKSKPKINQHSCDTVVVSPLAKTLQTCLNIYDSAGIQIFVDPLITEQVIWSAAIEKHAQQLMKEFKKAKIEWASGANRRLFTPNHLSLAQIEQSPQGRDQLGLSLETLRTNNQIQNRQAFLARVDRFRRNLLKYHTQTKKKIAIISHKDVLEVLTATGYYQDLKLINKVDFSAGDIKNEFVPIDGVEGETNYTIPFCS